MLNNKGIASSTILVCLPLLILLGAIVWLLTIRLEGTVPVVRFAAEPSAIGVSQKLNFTLSDPKSGLKSLKVTLRQGQKETLLLETDYPEKDLLGRGKVTSVPVEIAISPKSLGLADGDAVLTISARDRSWRHWWHGNPVLFEKTLPVDTRPPQMEVLSLAHNVNQGGTGFIVYRLSERCPNSGVMVGDNFFPGYAGYAADPLVHLCFFALKPEQGVGTNLALQADDVVGNHSTIGFMHHIRAKAFKKDSIPITDSFLNSKLPEFDLTGPVAAGSLLDQFLKVNREVRADNFKTITGFTAKTDPVLRWKGAFMQLPNGANRASFAQDRTYMYNGAAVDQQTHLGLDFASLAHSPIPAANAGKVVCAERIGIYGNTVILDHGFGVFSLYGHMSDMSVTVGQEVQKGDTLGHTGTTGWAAGDHLHFSMLVHDIFVDPVEWFDASWIANNVTSKLPSGAKAH